MRLSVVHLVQPLAEMSLIVEQHTEMEQDLAKEWKTMTRLLWAKREEQILGAFSSTAGLYGDLWNRRQRIN
jgi:hypothetical protein